MEKIESLVIKFEDMNKAEQQAGKAFETYQINVFDFCLSAFNSGLSGKDIAKGIKQTEKSVALFLATGKVFAEFDGFAEFSELSALTPSQVKELAQDRKLGVKGLKDLVDGAEDILELVKNLEKSYNRKAPAPAKEKGKGNGRTKKENSPAVGIDKALETIVTFINECDDMAKVIAVRDALVSAIQNRHAKEQAKVA